jgi:protein-histidine pros-kinase
MTAGLDLSGRHKDGREFQVEISLAPHQSPEGLLMVSAIRSVAAHRRVRREHG